MPEINISRSKDKTHYTKLSDEHLTKAAKDALLVIGAASTKICCIEFAAQEDCVQITVTTSNPGTNNVKETWEFGTSLKEKLIEMFRSATGVHNTLGVPA